MFPTIHTYIKQQITKNTLGSVETMISYCTCADSQGVLIGIIVYLVIGGFQTVGSSIFGGTHYFKQICEPL
jgi:hypothetical protein